MAVYTDSFTGVDGTDLPDHDAAWTDAGDARPFEIQSNEVTRVTPGGNFSAAFVGERIKLFVYDFISCFGGKKLEGFKKRPIILLVSEG